MLNKGLEKEDQIFAIMKLLKLVRWSWTLYHIFKAADRVEHLCSEIHRLVVNSKGLWSHSAMNSHDLSLELANSPQAVTFVKGDKKGFHSFRAFSRSFAALSHWTQGHESQLFTLKLHFLSTALERIVSKNSQSYCSLPFAIYCNWTLSCAAAQSANKEQLLTESPLCPRGPNWCCANAEGKPSKILNEWAGSMHQYGHKMSYCDGLLGVSLCYV